MDDIVSNFLSKFWPKYSLKYCAYHRFEKHIRSNTVLTIDSKSIFNLDLFWSLKYRDEKRWEEGRHSGVRARGHNLGGGHLRWLTKNAFQGKFKLKDKKFEITFEIQSLYNCFLRCEITETLNPFSVMLFKGRRSAAPPSPPCSDVPGREARSMKRN